MKKLSLFATLGIVALVSSFAPVNANPSDGSMDASAEESYIIDPATGEKIDPETGAVLELEESEVVGEGNVEVIEEDGVIVEPTEESASE